MGNWVMGNGMLRCWFSVKGGGGGGVGVGL